VSGSVSIDELRVKIVYPSSASSFHSISIALSPTSVKSGIPPTQTDDDRQHKRKRKEGKK
jgi:hypothetical protein